jgi:hypothetical protein
MWSLTNNQSDSTYSTQCKYTRSTHTLYTILYTVAGHNAVHKHNQYTVTVHTHSSTQILYTMMYTMAVHNVAHKIGTPQFFGIVYYYWLGLQVILFRVNAIICLPIIVS